VGRLSAVRFDGIIFMDDRSKADRVGPDPDNWTQDDEALLLLSRQTRALETIASILDDVWKAVFYISVLYWVCLVVSAVYEKFVGKD